MKKFIKEFKEFIAKGNVLDMAIGVIIAGAFSAIVTALTNKILMPIVNSLLAPATKGDKIYTILWSSVKEVSAEEVKAMDEISKSSLSAYQLGPDGSYYSKLFYIDWSAFIEAIINFFFIALTRFIILKVIMTITKKAREANDKIIDEIKTKHKKEKIEITEETKNNNI